MHERNNASALACEILYEALLADPLGDLCATLINFDHATKLAGWDTAGIVGCVMNSAIELGLKNTERSIIEPAVLDLPELVRFR
jgi:hypothetical protein